MPVSLGPKAKIILFPCGVEGEGEEDVTRRAYRHMVLSNKKKIGWRGRNGYLGALPNPPFRASRTGGKCQNWRNTRLALSRQWESNVPVFLSKISQTCHRTVKKMLQAIGHKTRDGQTIFG